MQSVVIANADPNVASILASSLSLHFRSVAVANSCDDACHAVAKYRAQLVIADLETLDLATVQQLCLDFPETIVVCTHRVPDEEMWARSLSAGAIDCCESQDVHNIILTYRRNTPLAHSHAA